MKNYNFRFRFSIVWVKLTRSIQQFGLAVLEDGRLVAGNRWRQLCMRLRFVDHLGRCSCSFRWRPVQGSRGIGHLDCLSDLLLGP